MSSERRGIAGAGNWIIDHVYICDRWPREETLSNVLEESRGTGGAPYNGLVDLAKFDEPGPGRKAGPRIPLEAIGLTGRDADGEFIRRNMAELGVDAAALSTTGAAPTSYTLVIVAKETGRRTFFHNRGANAHFGPEHVPVDKIKARLVHLAYLLLLDRMDEPDEQFGTVAARLLKRLQDAGIETSIDVVSEDSQRFPRIVKPALKYADYAILNELEAGRTPGRDLKPNDKPDPKAIRAAAEELLHLGVKRLVCIHMPEGGYVRTADGQELWQPSLQLPPGYIRGGAGAGDAFCAGMLYGIHEQWDLVRSLKLAVAAATVCLADPTCTASMCSLERTMQLTAKFPYQASVF
ncbi:MAG: carbohydrate kinase family protein [Planctomycetota bacterium]|nr:carbohydrate kinase family protein [Planctomycetota bacterium]